MIGTIYGRRDINYVRLGEMATGAHGPDYGPAGVMLVDLALALDSLNLADDMPIMLLLRAEETWPGDDCPLPMERGRINDLLEQVCPRLSEDQLSHAKRCFMSDELFLRMFHSDADFLTASEGEQCQSSLGVAD